MKKDIGEVAYEQMYEEPLVPKDLRRIKFILGQLSDKPRQLTREDFSVVARNSVVLVARLADSRIVGMVILTQDHTFSGRAGGAGCMHDLVVDKAFRGHNIGRKLIEKLKWYAKAIGMKKARFTSRPDRIEANSLYVSMGAMNIETNVYQFEFKD
jgi:ribosomal protein S18 acetylase RimI-like enzyme